MISRCDDAPACGHIRAAQTLRGKSMRIEIIHTRHVDSPCEHTVFLDETPVEAMQTITVDVYDIDPGAGHALEDWQESTEHDCAKASPAVAEQLRTLRDDIAESSDYIERGA